MTSKIRMVIEWVDLSEFQPGVPVLNEINESSQKVTVAGRKRPGLSAWRRPRYQETKIKYAKCHSTRLSFKPISPLEGCQTLSSRVSIGSTAPVIFERIEFSEKDLSPIETRHALF
jgi:hypothetical protein